MVLLDGGGVLEQADARPLQNLYPKCTVHRHRKYPQVDILRFVVSELERARLAGVYQVAALPSTATTIRSS